MTILIIAYKLILRRIAQLMIGNSVRVFLFKRTFIEIGHHVQMNEYINVIDNKYKNMLTIGNYCNIGAGVCFVTVSGPSFPHPDMHDRYTKLSKGKIVIEDGVWLGVNVVVLPGVCIGKHSIVGSNAVITKDIPPYSIVTGNPGKVIKTRKND